MVSGIDTPGIVLFKPCHSQQCPIPADVDPQSQMNAQDDSADEDEPNMAGHASEEGFAETASPVFNLTVHLD